MDSFIYQKESLSYEICDEIISLFESQKELQNAGVVGSDTTDTKYVIDKTVKKTVDLEIPSDANETNIWFAIKNKLIEEIQSHLAIYYQGFNDVHFFDLIHKNKSINNFLIQKYKMNEGVFKYHNDFCVDFMNRKTRIINFIWYLNDVEEGGETEFLGYYKIKPKKGNIILFPSEWFMPHCGNCPISNDKYIITGWIYIDI